MENYQGTIYLNGFRYWLKVRLPGQKKDSYFALKPKGSKFATKDKKLAELLAAEIWSEHIRKQKTKVWDGKLSTLVNLYHQRNLNYYLPPSNQATEIARCIFALAEFCPNILADDFGPLMLKKFREFVITGDKFDWNRKIINRNIGHIKRMFKWATSEQLVSVHTYTALTTIDGLRMGRTIARESKRVKPVPIEAVKAVMTFVTPVVSDMIQVQLLTGMRPGELCRIRPCDIDRSANIWIYQPKAVNSSQYDHKTAYLDTKKIILIGPKAQKILQKYLFRPENDYCFKPSESDAQARKKKHQARITPLKYGNRPGTNNRQIRKFNDYFLPGAYRTAIQRACKKAGVEKWHPHQLRHTAATEIRKEFNLDAARAVLGHKKLSMTDEYAELDFAKASEVIASIG